MRVCLASTSPARLMLLQQFGIRPLTVAPDVDEDAVIASVETAEGRVLAPDEHVLLLARRKAAAVAARLVDDVPDFDGIVIGGDSMFELDGVVLGTPFTVDSLGGAFISRVEGDPSTVVGMSVSTLRRLIRGLGVEWTDLWNTVDPSLAGRDGDPSTEDPSL